MDEPMKPVTEMKNLFGRFSPGMRLGEDDTQPAGGDPAALLESLGDRFTSRMGMHLFEQWLDALTKGEGAAALDLGGGPGFQPRVAAVIRLDTEGRLLALAAQGALEGLGGSHVSSEGSGKRRVWSYGGDDGAHWTLVGDTVLVCNDRELARH